MGDTQYRGGYDDAQSHAECNISYQTVVPDHEFRILAIQLVFKALLNSFWTPCPHLRCSTFHLQFNINIGFLLD